MKAIFVLFTISIALSRVSLAGAQPNSATPYDAERAAETEAEKLEQSAERRRSVGTVLSLVSGAALIGGSLILYKASKTLSEPFGENTVEDELDATFAYAGGGLLVGVGIHAAIGAAILFVSASKRGDEAESLRNRAIIAPTGDGMTIGFSGTF